MFLLKRLQKVLYWTEQTSCTCIKGVSTSYVNYITNHVEFFKLWFIYINFSIYMYIFYRNNVLLHIILTQHLHVFFTHAIYLHVTLIWLLILYDSCNLYTILAFFNFNYLVLTLFECLSYNSLLLHICYIVYVYLVVAYVLFSYYIIME